ncbi:MAG: threonine synthase [Actinomycetota bacterium]|nr:threonine synthase [Actinomycetota bacterium]
MGHVISLTCKECGRAYDVSAIYVCEFCFAPLEPTYDLTRVRETISRASIEAGPRSLWRYIGLLPVADDAERIDIGAGFTPLVRSDRLARALGIEELYLKNDTANPTHSFKDRVVSVALSVAKSMGFDTVACASTGNLANAVAAHAAKAGFTSYVFIPHDLENAKVLTTAVYGGHVISVKGNYDDVNRLCSEIAQNSDWAFVNVNLRPFYSEGSKTIGFEIAEQLGWKAPDHVVVPVASGSLLTKVKKSFEQFHQVALIDVPHTRFYAAQADGCSPVASAVLSGAKHVRPVKPETIAKSLAIGNPADGDYAVGAVNESQGWAAAVSDHEIVEGIKLLAETEGIFTETAGGVTIASLKRLAEQGRFASGGSVVALITGMGLKTADVLEDRLRRPIEIVADLQVFEEELRLL